MISLETRKKEYTEMNDYAREELEAEYWGKFDDHNERWAAERESMSHEGEMAEQEDDYLDLVEFLADNASWSHFAASLTRILSDGGMLTDGQYTAAESMRTKCRAKATVVPGPAPLVVPNVQMSVDLTDVPTGLYADPQESDSRLKVKIEHGKAGTRWEGFIFAKDGAVYGEGQRYGTQVANSLQYRGQITSVLSRIAADPFEASKAYGRLTSTCGVCSRPLEDPVSVENGIGPICAKKF